MKWFPKLNNISIQEICLKIKNIQSQLNSLQDSETEEGWEIIESIQPSLKQDQQFKLQSFIDNATKGGGNSGIYFSKSNENEKENDVAVKSIEINSKNILTTPKRIQRELLLMRFENKLFF